MSRVTSSWVDCGVRGLSILEPSPRNGGTDAERRGNHGHHRSPQHQGRRYHVIPTLDQMDDYDVAAIADDVIGQYFSTTGTPYYVVDVDEDAYWAAVERHAIAH